MLWILVFGIRLLNIAKAQQVLVPIDLSVYGTQLYRTPSLATGLLVANLNSSTDPRNPEELGNLLEGDMKLPKPKTANGLIGNVQSSYRWPNATIIYEINANFTDSELGFINQAIDSYHSNTCIKFKQRTDEVAYISVENELTGCWSDVGRGDGMTQLNLQPGCANAVGTAIHEFMHALGFFHEHTRYDRDNYIYVNYSNMVANPVIYWNFMKVDPTEVTTFNIPYDLASIMHYTSAFFSVDPLKRPTMIPLVPYNGAIGQRDGFTKYDIQLINIMYCGEDQPVNPWLTTNAPPSTVSMLSNSLDLSSSFSIFKNYFQKLFA